jgi:GntR family transcriptional regulator
MDIQISARDSTPVYSQIVDQIRRLIASRELAEGDELPSIRGLAEQLIVNPNTVARAYRELEAAGLVGVRRGSYTHVAATEEQAEATKRELILQQVDRLLMDARQMKVPLELLFQLMTSRVAETSALDDAESDHV